MTSIKITRRTEERSTSNYANHAWRVLHPTMFHYRMVCRNNKSEKRETYIAKNIWNWPYRHWSNVSVMILKITNPQQRVKQGTRKKFSLGSPTMFIFTSWFPPTGNTAEHNFKYPTFRRILNMMRYYERKDNEPQLATNENNDAMGHHVKLCKSSSAFAVWCRQLIRLYWRCRGPSVAILWNHKSADPFWMVYTYIHKTWCLECVKKILR